MKAGHLDINEFLFTQQEADIIITRLIFERQLKSVIDIGGREGSKIGFVGSDKLECVKSNIYKDDGDIFDDICNSKIKSDSFDIVHSRNLFEHLLEPWKAAEHCVRICKSRGILYHMTVFSWSLHVDPVDCFRYTHIGLAHIFERTDQVETIKCGYSLYKFGRWGVIYLGEKR